jgi:hypothetical protein
MLLLMPFPPLPSLPPLFPPPSLLRAPPVPPCPFLPPRPLVPDEVPLVKDELMAVFEVIDEWTTLQNLYGVRGAMRGEKEGGVWGGEI